MTEFAEISSVDYTNDLAANAESIRNEEILRIESYARRELPRLVRSELEKKVLGSMSSVEKQLRKELVEIVLDCQAKVFQHYSRETNPDPSDPRKSLQPDASVSRDPAVPHNSADVRQPPADAICPFAPPPPTPEAVFTVTDPWVVPQPSATVPPDLTLVDSGYYSDCGRGTLGSPNSSSVSERNKGKERQHLIRRKPCPVSLYGRDFPAQSPMESRRPCSYDFTPKWSSSTPVDNPQSLPSPKDIPASNSLPVHTTSPSCHDSQWQNRGSVNKAENCLGPTSEIRQCENLEQVSGVILASEQDPSFPSMTEYLEVLTDLTLHQDWNFGVSDATVGQDWSRGSPGALYPG